MSALQLSYGITRANFTELMPAATLQSGPIVTGDAREGFTLTADASDIWTVAGQPTTVTMREYRLLIDEILVSAAQSSATVTLPLGTAGQTYKFQMHVVTTQSNGMFSPWTTLDEGFVLYGEPQATTQIPPITLTVGDGPQIIDLAAYFIGSDLSFSLQSGELPIGSTLVGSTLSIMASEVFGAAPITIRATNPGGAAEQTIDINIAATTPGAFQIFHWTINPGLSPGDADITLLALPGNGGAEITNIQYRVDGGAFVSLEANNPGIYPITGLSPIATQQIELRALNAVGAGSVSDIKLITPVIAFELTETLENEIEVNGVNGAITITVSAPAAYANYDAGNGPGVFIVDSADLTSGPVSLVPPTIVTNGMPEVGSTLSQVPGLWAFDGDNTAPAVTVQWERGLLAIPGETATSYALSAVDTGEQITIEETANGANGTRMARSAAVSIPSSSTTTLVTDTFDTVDGYALNDDIPTTSSSWTTIYSSPDIAATIAPVGTAEINGTTASNRHLRVTFDNPISDNQAIEVMFDSITEENRADPILSVRRTDGQSVEGTCVRAFFRMSTADLILSEFEDGSIIQANTTGSVALNANDIIRLEISGTTAVVIINGTIIDTLTDIAATGGAPCWGAYLGPNAGNIVRFSSAQVEDLT